VADTKLSLDIESIVRDAEQRAGTSEWDDSLVHEPLAILTGSIASESDLHEVGLLGAGERLRGLLAGYIGMQSDARKHPSILDESIERPIIIFGLPRCGTTLLHGLLASDPRNRAPAFWEALRPSPPPETSTFDTDPRRAEVQAVFDDMIERNPSLLASLPYSADLKAECNTLTQPTLRSVAFSAYYHAPTYESWYLEADHRSMFRYHRRALQQLQWHGPRGRWMLKAPPHLFTMHDLIDEYPDALLVRNHRDPKSVLSSNCALYQANRVLHTDSSDPHVVGSDCLELWATGCDRADAFSEARPDVAILDVHYEELVADPVATAARIYDAYDLEMTAEVEAVMRDYLIDNARETRPVEHHDLAEFGLSAGQVDERFDSYRTRNGIE
jgi:hypothetical protein